jgi:hypothetical protein
MRLLIHGSGFDWPRKYFYRPPKAWESAVNLLAGPAVVVFAWLVLGWAGCR